MTGLSFVVTLCGVLLVQFADSRSEPMVPEPAREARLYVLNKADASVSIIDPKSRKEVKTVKVGEGPHEAATSPDGRWVVVCNYGDRTPGSSLSVIDTHTQEVAKVIELGAYHRPHGIKFLPGQLRFIVTAEVEKKLLIVDLATWKVEAAIDTGQNISHMAALSSDAKRAFVANIGSGSVSVIDLESRELLKIVETGAGAEGICSVPTTREIWVTNRAANTVSVIDEVKLTVVATLKCPKFPIRAEILPDQAHVLVSCAESADLAVFRVSDRKVARRIAMPKSPKETDPRRRRLMRFGDSSVPIGILVEPDGKRAYIANTFSDIVSVVDLEAWKVVGSLKAGAEPDGLAWVPGL